MWLTEAEAAVTERLWFAGRLSAEEGGEGSGGDGGGCLDEENSEGGLQGSSHHLLYDTLARGGD